jgi:two-component system, cell cycle sensor histidine kinase and response regulator CckA
MAVISQNDRVDRIIQLIRKAAAGDVSSRVETSGNHNTLDGFAKAINELFEILKERTGTMPCSDAESVDFEERYKRLEANIPGMVYQFAMHPGGGFSFSYVNEWSKQLFDMQPDELMHDAARLIRLIHPHDRNRLNALLAQSAQTLQPWREVLRFNINGEMRWYDCMSRPATQPNGDIIWEGIVLEVTDQMRAAASLASSERRLSDIISASPIGIAIYDSTGLCISTNESLARIIGATKEQVLTQNYRHLDSWKRSGLLDKAQAALETKTAQWLKLTTTSTFGKELFLDCHLVPFGDGGLLFMSQDISDRTRAELALSENERLMYKVIDQSPHPIWISDETGTLIRINKACCDLLDIREDEVVGRYNILQDPNVIDQGHLSLVQSVFSKGETVNFTIEYDSAQVGQIELERTVNVILDVTVSPVKNEAGVITNAVITHRDITERKRLEKQLLQSQKLEAVGQLAGGVAHDFNNMLSVILGHAELIQSSLPAGHPLMKNILEIERAGLHSRDITRQLLAFSRRGIVAPKTVDVNRLISQTSKTLSQLIGENITLKFAPEDGLWKVRFDPTQLDQILINLAVNARDAMPEGGHLAIETANTYLDETAYISNMEITPGHYVKVTISDDGVGMDRKTESRIFEPFFTTKVQGKGTGLGLSTVYGIVKQNGGLIHVYSEKNKGTTFNIYIPRILDEDRQNIEGEVATLKSHSGTILLVEDDDMVRAMTTELLKKIGYTVVAATSPEDALAICENESTKIDLLLSDVVMPKMNGAELSGKIHTMRPDTKVLFMSGYAENIIIRHGVLMDGIRFIQKPFSLQTLADKVHEAMNG